MTTKRFIGACAAAFVVSQIFAIAIHGFILRADYLPFYGKLLRPMDGANGGDWRMLLLPLAHLLFVIAFVWIYDRIAPTGPWMREGLKFGVIGWMMAPAPMYLLWYAEQPWPDTLVVKQLVLELVATVVIGLTVAAIARKKPRGLETTRAVSLSLDRSLRSAQDDSGDRLPS